MYTAEAAGGLPVELTEQVTPLEAHTLVVNNVVALALAGNGTELLRVVELARFLAPYSIALSAEDAESASAGAQLAAV